jgi:inosose dehydratase
MSAKNAKIAAAPISWGVCEVPGWGHQMSPARVLKEMAELGFSATEFGPEGFLPMEPALKASILKEHNMTAVGGFVPVILHRADHDPIPGVQKELEGYAAAGAKTLVLAANSGITGYDEKLPVLTDGEWDILFNNLNRIQAEAAKIGVKSVLHPHVGTMVETADHVNRVVKGSKIPFCLYTGNMMIGVTDIVAFSKDHADRVAHSHLKDVNNAMAAKVRSHEVTYYDGMLAGLYTPLGQGDANIRAVVRNLIMAGYDGWFVLEQDNALSAEPAVGAGPFKDAKASVEFLRQVLAELVSEGF